MNHDEQYMREALKEAQLACDEKNWPIGCVIELNGKIIARAHNQVYSTHNRLAHAEMLALSSVAQELNDNHGQATLFTTYEPCPMCFGAIILSRVKRVVAGIDLDRSGAMFFRENLPLLFKQDKFRVEFQLGVLSQSCREIFLRGEPTAHHILQGNISL